MRAPENQQEQQMSEERMPMDGLDEPVNPPAEDQGGQTEQPDRARDESGRFAPKQEERQRGEPNRESARRREAAERDEWKGKFEERDKAYAALQKRLDDMASFAKGDDPNAEQKPDPIAALSTKLDGITESLQQRQQREQAEETWNQVKTYADQDEARFTVQNADFPNAVQHYIGSRLREMQALGLDQGQATQALQREATDLLLDAAQRNASPAEMIYGLAQARGYQPSVVPAMQGAPSQAQPQQRQAGGRSFGTGGGPAGGGLTAAQIAAMDESDYAAFRSTPEGKRAIQRAMGKV